MPLNSPVREYELALIAAHTNVTELDQRFPPIRDLTMFLVYDFIGSKPEDWDNVAGTSDHDYFATSVVQSEYNHNTMYIVATYPHDKLDRQYKLYMVNASKVAPPLQVARIIAERILREITCEY